MSEPQVAWKALEAGATVVTPDGEEAAHVVEIVGDPEADIFNGLVVRVGTLGRNCYLPAERVRGIWPRRVQVDATAGEVRALPPYEEPVAGRIVPEDRLLSRVRRLFRRP